MKKKFFYLLPCIMFVILVFAGCRNDDINLPDLDPDTKRGKDPAGKLSLTGVGWEETPNLSINDDIEVSIKVVEDTITPSGLTFVCGNNSGKHLIFSEDYSIEAKINDIWYEIPKLTDKYDFSGAGFDLPYGQSKEQDTDWGKLYGDLDGGQYRLLKEITDLKGSNYYKKECVAAEFVIE